MLAQNHKPTPEPSVQHHPQAPEPTPQETQPDRRCPTSEFTSAMHRIRQMRESSSLSDTLLDASSWAQSSVYEPLVSVLGKVKDTIINRNVMVPVTAFMTFVFNPVLFSELKGGSGPTIDLLTSASERIAISSVGQLFLNVVQSVCNNPLVIESNSLISPTSDPMVNAMVLLGGLSQIFILGYPVVRTVEYILSTANRKERAKEGREPLPETARPKLVIVGDTEFADMLVHGLPPSARNTRRPIVIAHPNEQVPTSYNEKLVDYHVHINAGENRPLGEAVIRNSGLNRASKIVLAGFNHNKAVFYGNGGTSTITPSSCSTFLNLLAKEKDPRATNVAILLPKNAMLLGTRNFHDILDSSQPVMQELERKGVTVSLIHPEDVLLEMLEEHIRPLLAQRTASGETGPLQICLIGDTNHAALENFSKALEVCMPEVKITLVANEMVGEVRGQKFQKLAPSARIALQAKILNKSDLNLVYGDDDSITTDLATLVVNDNLVEDEARRREKAQTVCIMETERGSVDAEQLGLKSLCLYDRLRDRVVEAINT